MRIRSHIALSLIAVALLCSEAIASAQDLREKIVSGGRERSYRVFVPDGFGKSGPGPAVVLFNGSGSNVDGLMDPWKDIARKEGVLLIGPGAFQQCLAGPAAASGARPCNGRRGCPRATAASPNRP